MTRLKVWLGLMAANFAIEVFKAILGFAISPGYVVSAAVWSGAALLAHWFLRERPETGS